MQIQNIFNIFSTKKLQDGRIKEVVHEWKFEKINRLDTATVYSLV